MARLHQTVFWVLLVGIIGVHCYLSAAADNEYEETPLSSSINQLSDDSDDENLDISVPEGVVTHYGAGRVRRDRKPSGVEKRKNTAAARRRAEIRRERALEAALERARVLRDQIAAYVQQGLSQFDAVLRVYNENEEIRNQVLRDFNPNLDEN